MRRKSWQIFGVGIAFALAALGMGNGIVTAAPAANVPIVGWGDQGNGTYKNPVLKADYSDPDVIRVGSDFYLIGSEFHYVGIQVLHSKDLVNWQIIGQVFPRLTMDKKYDTMQGYGKGTWAPSLRYHDGRFYIYVCTPTEGLFMWHSKNPAGPWSDTVTVKQIAGWEDPCPFWDDDGQAYLVHSHTGAGPLILSKMSADGTKLLDDGVEIYRGPVAEGPKLYKRHGFYYISLPEGGVSKGGQTVLRAKNIYGPYERKVVLADGSPHQGGLVDLDNGESWFIGFLSAGYLGRIDYLEPVKWGDDDWPVFGNAGQPVDVWKKPNVGHTYPIAHPQTSDEFGDKTLSPIWQWNHNPIPAAVSLTERKGWLRLKATPADGLSTAHNTLTQKLWDTDGTFTEKLDIRRLADGGRAGVCFLCGDTFGAVGVVQEGAVRRLYWEGGQGPVLTGNDLWLRGSYHDGVGHFAYSLDGKTFTDTNVTFPLTFKDWKGARLGIFCYGNGGGAVDSDWVHYEYHSPPVSSEWQVKF